MKKPNTTVVVLATLGAVIIVSALCITAIIIANNAARPKDDTQATAAHQTVVVQLTQNAFNQFVRQLTLTAQAYVTQTPVNFPTPNQSSPQPNPTTAYPTAAYPTAAYPTATSYTSPTSTSPPSIPTNTPIPCNQAAFISDITVPDGSVFAPKDVFLKVWRLKNTGTCVWDRNYAVIFSSGDSMEHEASSFWLEKNVNPGETVDVSVSLRAPSSEGEYSGQWRIKSDDGIVFGLGADQKPFWVNIKVRNRPDMDEDHPLHFAYSYRAARWMTPDSYLPCPASSDNYTYGSIYYSDTPRLEGGYQDDEAALIVIPNDGDDGLIAGQYPAIRIENGDHFKALVGCTYDTPDCDVTFKLNYKLDGEEDFNLGVWQEKSEGEYTSVDVDLSNLAGKDVRFLLIVQNNDSSDDDKVFWLDPHIER